MLDFIRTYKENLILMAGHFATDICQGSVSAALTIMLEQHVLHSKLEISYLVLASTLVSSLVQPVVGYFSDRKPRPYLMSLGMLTAALGFMFIGLITDFATLFVLLTASGVGVAVFHPQGGKLANSVSVRNKGLGMGIFSVGGNLGFAAGPLLLSAATAHFGLPGIMVIGFPAFIMCGVLTARNRLYRSYTEREEIRLDAAASTERESYSGFALLTVMIYFRSSVLFGLTTFIPTYFVDMFGLGAREANVNLTVIAVASAIASLGGGILSDRVGFKNVLFYSVLLFIPWMLLFRAIETPLAAGIALVPAALCVYGSLSSAMVLGQKLLCRHVGLASGVTIGLGISFGGLTSPLFGYIGDHYGAAAIMDAVIVFAAFAALFAWFVPDIDRIRAEERARAAAGN